MSKAPNTLDHIDKAFNSLSSQDQIRMLDHLIDATPFVDQFHEALIDSAGQLTDAYGISNDRDREAFIDELTPAHLTQEQRVRFCKSRDERLRFALAWKPMGEDHD
jgi:hypothetical protein